MPKAYLNWSSGKDSSLALYHAMHSGKFSVETLFSVIKTGSKKIPMHGIGIELLSKQAKLIGIPLTIFQWDVQRSNKDYEFAMMKQIDKFQKQGITTALFGDLYMEPLRNAREQNCKRSGIKAEFPLWKIPQTEIMDEFIRLGFKAIITCIDSTVLPDYFLGKVIDAGLIKKFPSNVDICGENGEYHSFVFDGPFFYHPVKFDIRRKYYRDYPNPSTGTMHRYWYLDLE